MAKTRKKNQERKIILSTRTFVEFSLYVYITYIMLPFVSAVLPSSIRTMVLLYIMGSTLVFTTFANMKRMGHIMALHVTAILMITIGYFGKNVSSYAGYITYFTNRYMFWGALVYAYTIQSWENHRKKRMARFLILLISVTMVTTFIGNLVYPEASRILADISRDNSVLYLTHNIGPYGFIYGLVVILPFLIWMSKQKKRYLLLVILVFAVLFVAQYSLAILIAVAALIIMLLVPDGKPIKVVGAVSLLLLAFALFTPLLDAILIRTRELFESMGLTVLSNRFTSVSDLLVDNNLTGGALTRTELYMKSLNAWVQSPVIGNLFSGYARTLGGHSEILDLLGSGGLVGMLIFIISMMPHIRRLKSGKETKLSIYKRYSFIIFLVIALLNPVFVSGMISIPAFLLPELLDMKNEEFPPVSS